MTAQSEPRRLMIRWTALRGIAAIVVFLLVAAVAEYFVVLYARGQIAADNTVLQTSFQFPGTGWPITIAVSPLFHIVPIAVMVTLAFSWTYLTRKMATKPEPRGRVEPFLRQKRHREKSGSKVGLSLQRFFRNVKTRLQKTKGISYVWKKVHFARATLRSALAVLSAFLMFVLIFILFTYPQLIYRAVSAGYAGNSSFYSWVMSVGESAKGFADAVSPIGWIASAINNALLGAAPTVKNMGLALGNLIKPLANLDNAGKYLVFQNAAAWISVITVLFYGEYWRKRPRYKK